MNGGMDNETIALVVTFNRRDLLRENLRRLLGQEGASCDILVVDNNSTDGTAEMLREDFDDPRITYFNTEANLGGAGGFHLGLYWAVIAGYKYAWVMDDDSLPSANALQELLKVGRSLGDWGFLSSSVYWTDGNVCMANRPKRSLFRHLGPKDYDSPKPSAVAMGSFVSMLIPTDVVCEVGLPLYEYFIWTDDYEFSGRVSRLHPCYFVPGSKVTHAMMANTRASLAKAEGERIQRFRMLFRNDMHCYRQYGVKGYAYLGIKAMYTAVEVMLIAPGDRGKRLESLVAGLMDGRTFDASPYVMLGGVHSGCRGGSKRSVLGQLP